MLAPLPPPSYTYANYRLWQGEERWELIGGEAFLMSPAPGTRHQEVAGELHRQLANFLLGKSCQVLPAPIDVLLPHGEEDDEQVDTVVQPDLVVVCDRAKITKKGIRGAPDWVIEILSPSTATRDQVVKLKLYEQSGVHEYWLVDPDEGWILVYRRQGQGFGEPSLYRQGTLGSSVLPGFELDRKHLPDPF